MSKINWKIYYSNGETYSNLDGPVEAAPGNGVQLIVQISEHTGRSNLIGFDYYIWQNEWFGVDMMGLLLYLQRPGWKKVIPGELVSDTTFRKIIEVAEADTALPPRSGYLPHERRA